MTKEEFYSALSNTHNFNWSRQGTGQVIRAQLIGHTNRKDDCIVEFYTPITAVAFNVLGCVYHPADDREAAAALKLGANTTQGIILSSDFPPLL